MSSGRVAGQLSSFQVMIIYFIWNSQGVRLTFFECVFVCGGMSSHAPKEDDNAGQDDEDSAAGEDASGDSSSEASDEDEGEEEEEGGLRRRMSEANYGPRLQRPLEERATRRGGERLAWKERRRASSRRVQLRSQRLG